MRRRGAAQLGICAPIPGYWNDGRFAGMPNYGRRRVSGNFWKDLVPDGADDFGTHDRSIVSAPEIAVVAADITERRRLQNDQYRSPHSLTPAPYPAKAIPKVEPLRQLDGIHFRPTVVCSSYVRSITQSIGKTAGPKKCRRICISWHISLRGAGCQCQRKGERPCFFKVRHFVLQKKDLKNLEYAQP